MESEIIELYMVDDVKEFCKRVSSAKEQTGIFMYLCTNVYMCAENLKRHQQSSTHVLHVRGEVWHTMHIDVDSPEPLPSELLHEFPLHCLMLQSFKITNQGREFVINVP